MFESIRVRVRNGELEFSSTITGLIMKFNSARELPLAK